MPDLNYPTTLAIGQQIVSYLATLTYPNTSTLVYTATSLESIKDISDLIANGGVCAEVYGNTDTSDRHGFGGRIWDIQSFFILSMCSLDTPTLAQQIYNVRDALVIPFQTHAVLGGSVFNLWSSELKPGMKFFRIFRNGQWVRAHLAELEVKSEWQVISPPGVIS